MRKPYRIAFAALAAAVLAGGAVLRFALHWERVSLTATALCVVGLALSFGYKGGKYRVPLRVLQVLAALLAAACVAGWFIELPHWYDLSMNLAALGVNVPLAVTGIKKNP